MLNAYTYMVWTVYCHVIHYAKHNAHGMHTLFEDCYLYILPLICSVYMHVYCGYYG